MPLHGKIVVIKRSGGDGTEFPLTASCLFGRKPDCDIRIQLPQVSKEHCKIDLNENKEVILTNLSSVNPTLVNGEALQQSERLKHGDVITIIDRSFRFEYPPAPTPKKRLSTGGKTETLKVLHDQTAADTVNTEGDKRISAVSTGAHLKDGTNHDNIQRSLEKTMELESKEEVGTVQNKTASPFNDLYQMIKKSLDVKTPRKSSVSLLQTPSSRFCSPKPVSVKKNYAISVTATEHKSTLKKNETKSSSAAAETNSNGTPKSVKKQRKSFQGPSNDMPSPKAKSTVQSESTSPQKRGKSRTSQQFTVCEVNEQTSSQTPRRSSTEAKIVVTSPETQHLPKSSPRNSGKVEMVKETSKKRKRGELAADLPTPQIKRKRVSFGGHLSPELFDKCLPPDSPLRKGATPRRSLSLYKPKQSLLRRASVIGLIQEQTDNVQSPAKMRTPSPKNVNIKKASPKSRSPSPKVETPGKKSPKSRSPSPKVGTPAKKSPKSRSPSPKVETPGKKSPKSRSPSPKVETPGKKSPKSRSPSPKVETPGKKSPKSRSPSPKVETPGKKSPKSRSASPKVETPGKKSPKPRSASPKVETPGKKSPKSRSPSLKVETPGKKSPKSSAASPKVETPGKKSPKSRSASPKAETLGKKLEKSRNPSPATGRSPSRNKVETLGFQTPTVQGRFSVSRISTPSPTAVDTAADKMHSEAVTPKLPLRRKSMKSTSQKSVLKSAVKVMSRRSGVSRASMKVTNSWANIVKFGQKKAEVGGPVKPKFTKKTVKKTVSKLQTPARKVKGHVSTGHADSPVTIVVGRAHKRMAVHPTVAAPKSVVTAAFLKKHVNMDEDLTGISEMYKTPVIEKKRRSVIDSSAIKTPVGSLGTSVVEPSVLNTPEEPGEMIVSPLNTSSTAKDTRYNSEAVQRLLSDEESSFNCDIPLMEADDSSEHCTDLKMSVTTPRQKPELQDCLTGVKRIMKTPRQKTKLVEDLRGNLLKTPKQKLEQPECLTGVKRIMKTPRQQTEPVEDLRGKILKTPKQKLEPQECLTGVKRIFSTPQEEVKLLEDLQRKPLESPAAGSSDCVAEVVTAEDLSGIKSMNTPQLKKSPPECLTGIKRMMKTPRHRCAPVEDMVGLKRLMKTPREKSQPVRENFGIKRLMKSPRLRGIEPVEDFEGLKELIEEPVPDSTGHQEITEIEDQTLDRALDITNEADEKEAAVDHTDEVPLRKDESSDDRPTVSQTADHDSVSGKPEEMSKPKTVVRGRRARMVDAEPTEDKQKATEISEETVISAPVKGRRGKKTGAVAPPAVRQTRGRTAKTTEIKGVEVSAEQRTAVTSKVAIQSKIGRHARKASESATVQEVNAEAEMVPQPESEEALSLNVSPKAGDKTAAGLKAKRRGKTKQPDQLLPPKNDVARSLDVSQSEKEAESNEVSCDPLTVMPTWIDENPSDNVECARQASVTQSALEEKADAGHITETDTAIVQKKSSQGRRAKLESKTAEEVPEQSGDPVIAPVRGRRGRKAATAAPPAVRQMRNRNAKSHECSSNEHEMPPEKDETPLSEITTEAESDQNLILNAEKAAMKPLRGRKPKQTPAKPSQPEPKNDEVVNEEHPTEDEQPQKPILALGKPRRGRKTKTDNEQSEASGETVATVETEQQVVPLVRAKRGRSARQEETNEENETKSLKPITKFRRTRKAEQDHVEPSQVQHNQVGISKDVEAPVIAEPIMTDHMDMDSKPRRGGRTAKREHESEKPAESKSDDVQEITAASETDKPKRGRRARHITAEVTTVVPGGKADSELEAEEKNMKLVQAKATRAKGVKKDESVAVPAKRTRRTAVDSFVESTDLVSGSASSSAEPPKRGRRAAAKPPADAAIQTSDQANISEGSNVVVEDTKISKRSVKWKTDVEVFEIQKATPVKAVRGTKSKRGHIDPESQNMLKGASKTEEKDLSETTEAQPAKRARRGTTDTDKSASKLQKVETETPLKTRRGRSAKK